MVHNMSLNPRGMEPMVMRSGNDLGAEEPPATAVYPGSRSVTIAECVP